MTNETGKIWVVHSGKNAEWFDRFAAESIVGIDFHAGEDVRGAAAREEIISAYNQNWGYVRDAFPEGRASVKTQNSIKYKAGALFTFCREMRQNELVITNNRREPKYKIGRIIGDCQYEGSRNDSWYFRAVKWRDEINSGDLTGPLKKFLGRPPTLFSINREEYQREILEMINGER